MACAAEETFGPVVPVTRFKTETEVIAAANGTPYGLAAYFYSSDVRRIWRLAEALEAGLVGINEGALADRRREGIRLRPRGFGAWPRRLHAPQIPVPGSALVGLGRMNTSVIERLTSTGQIGRAHV